TSTTQTHITTLSEIHHVDVGLGDTAIYRIDLTNDLNDPNNSCNYFELTDDPTRVHGGVAGKGMFLYNSTKIELNTLFCGMTGPIKIAGDGPVTLSAPTIGITGTSIILSGPVTAFDPNNKVCANGIIRNETSV